MCLPCIFTYWNQIPFINVQNMVPSPCEPIRLPETDLIRRPWWFASLLRTGCIVRSVIHCHVLNLSHGRVSETNDCIAFFLVHIFVSSGSYTANKQLYLKEASSCLCCRQDTIYRVFCKMSLHRRYSVNIHWLIDHSRIYA